MALRSRVSKCSQICGANSCLPYRHVLSQTVLETPTDVVFVVLALSCPEFKKKKVIFKKSKSRESKHLHVILILHISKQLRFPKENHGAE